MFHAALAVRTLDLTSRLLRVHARAVHCTTLTGVWCEQEASVAVWHAHVQPSPAARRCFVPACDGASYARAVRSEVLSVLYT
eukprot:3940317-Rhodomonas_salina.2